MKWIAVLLLLFLTSPAVAQCTKKCKPRHCHCHVPTAPTPAPSLGGLLISGLELSGGFRWETHDALVCPSARSFASPRVTDPPYLGLGLRLPLARNCEWYSQFQRDFTERPDWIAFTQISLYPWRK